MRQRPNSLLEARSFYHHLNISIASLRHYSPSPAELLLLGETIGLSKQSGHSRVKVGCILADRNKIVSFGRNEEKSHPIAARYKQYSISLCAEMAAILALIRLKNGSPERYTAFIARTDKRGAPVCSYPCLGCAAALRFIGIKRIVCLGWDNSPASIILRSE